MPRGLSNKEVTEAVNELTGWGVSEGSIWNVLKKWAKANRIYKENNKLYLNAELYLEKEDEEDE